MKTTRSGFTLLEMLTAIAVLALMMVFMFNIAGQSVKAWETGRRSMESAQTARIGMNLISSELRYAFAGVATNYGTNFSQTFKNFVPFVVTNGLPGQTGSDLVGVPGSQTLFFVSSVGPHEPQECVPFAEIGYLPTFVAKADGSYNMFGGTYALVRHGASAGLFVDGNTNYQDFYYRSAANLDGWTATRPATTNNRTPIVDNCIRLSLQFATTNVSGQITWTSDWASRTNLPLGVLVTMLLVDSKSAAKLTQINGMTVMPAATIDKATNGAPLGPGDTAARILREGSSVVRRFIPLVNSSYSPR